MKRHFFLLTQFCQKHPQDLLSIALHFHLFTDRFCEYNTFDHKTEKTTAIKTDGICYCLLKEKINCPVVLKFQSSKILCPQ